MAENNGPSWGAFENVKDGMTVAVNNNLELTGQVFLDRNRATPSWNTVIKGQRLLLDSQGKVVEAAPGDISTGTYLKILTWDMPQSYSVVTPQTRATGGQATLTESTLRDQFAMNILNSMITTTPGLKDADDAGMYSAATVAYRFAEAMMRSAANYRANENNSQEPQEVSADTIVSGNVNVKVENTVTTDGGVSTINPLIVKGNDTYSPDDNPSNDIAGVLNVNVVAGGGGGGGSVDLDDLIGAMGYVKGTIPITGDTQADKFDALIAAVTNAGKLKRGDVDTLSDYTDVSAIVVFNIDGVNPYKVTPNTLSKTMYTYLDDRYALRLKAVSDASQQTYSGGYYYQIAGTPSALTITLPALSAAENGPVKIFMVRATINGTLTVSFSGTLKWRGSKQTSLNGEYEIDFIDNGSCWTVGVTEIVSN